MSAHTSLTETANILKRVHTQSHSRCVAVTAIRSLRLSATLQVAARQMRSMRHGGSHVASH